MKLYFLNIKLNTDINKDVDKIIAYLFGTNDLAFSDEEYFSYSSCFWRNVSNGNCISYNEYLDYTELNKNRGKDKIKDVKMKKEFDKLYYDNDILRLYDNYLIEINFGNKISFYDNNLNNLGENVISIAFRQKLNTQ
jgi:hypothetical protein